MVLAVKADTGETLWKQERQFPSVGGVAYANGLLFNASSDGTLYALDAKTGSELWKDKMTTVHPKTGERRGTYVASSPSIADGRIFACQGFTFFKSAGEGNLWGGLVAYGLPDETPPVDAGASGEAGPLCDTAAATMECRRVATEEQLCREVGECGCDHCACAFAECQKSPGCIAIRHCGQRTGCLDQGNATMCYQPSTCMDVISRNGGAQGPAAMLASEVGACARAAGCAVSCAGDGGTTDSGADAADARADAP